MLLTIDSRKRIPLGKVLLGKDVTLFDAKVEGGRIILEPMRAVPEREAWLYKNPKALDSVMRGLKDSSEGRVKTYLSKEK
ncbi:MAG: hypothetical protein HQL13_03250 [Candidatus Omnitrophica bacterium]|nr:hypothetical protein [Candidatus Omnitrophota bacterium]